MIIISKHINEEWYEGRIGSHEGIFPASYVELIPKEHASRATKQELPQGSYEAVAMFPFQAETSQDLSLQVYSFHFCLILMYRSLTDLCDCRKVMF